MNATTTDQMPLLEVDNVSRRFGGFLAIDGCSFSVTPGSVTGLIGPNGAGKSTMFNLISGVYKPDSGHIRFRGNDVTGARPETISARGLGRTFQTPRLFFGLTVWENLMAAGRNQAGEHVHNALFRSRMVREAEQALSHDAWDVLRFLHLDHLADKPASDLSGGQRKLLSLGRVLMMKPALILLDEPVAGVNETLAAELFDHIQALNRQGIAFLVIEHHMDLVMRLSHEIVVMHNGATLAHGMPADIQRNEAVLEAYLGGAA